MSRRKHWESIYRTKGEGELSWHQDDPTLSLRLIRDVVGDDDRVIDVGGGTSTLGARLADDGRRKVVVVDLANAAIQRSRKRSGPGNHPVRWMRADITDVPRLGRFDVWHDRAVFHFLTNPGDRRAYVELARRTIPVGGHVILATFALDGPETCSGLDVRRYDGRRLESEFAPGFLLVREVREVHRTPWGVRQPFTYVVLRRVRNRARPTSPAQRADGGSGSRRSGPRLAARPLPPRRQRVRPVARAARHSLRGGPPAHEKSETARPGSSSVPVARSRRPPGPVPSRSSIPPSGI
ncbi:MAG: class I SAM-dependent methyltransferase [Thermoplasmata archaeon]|nr:class I SAM-dependent methyltransferase [Thermoplasmata archaeon]